MSTQPTSPPSDVADVAARLPPRGLQTDGLRAKDLVEDQAERVVDAIEMIGEETAAGFRPPGHCLDCTRLWSGVTGNPVHPLDWSTERELQLTAATARDACGTNLFSGHESALAGPSG